MFLNNLCYSPTHYISIYSSYLPNWFTVGYPIGDVTFLGDMLNDAQPDLYARAMAFIQDTVAKYPMSSSTT